MTKTNKKGTFGLIIAVLLLISIVFTLILMISGSGGVSGFFLRFGWDMIEETFLVGVFFFTGVLIAGMISYGAFRVTGIPSVGIILFIILFSFWILICTFDFGAIV